MSVPRGFRIGHQGDLACPHRDISCCPACAAAHETIVEVYGVHYWIDDPAEREELRQSLNDNAFEAYVASLEEATS